VLTDNVEVYNQLRKLVHHGRNENSEFEILGYNSKIPELNCGLISMQIKEIDNYINKVNQLADHYYKKLENISSVQIIIPDDRCISNHHKLVIRIKNRDKLKNHLKECGIATKIHYPVLLSDHPLLKDYKFRKSSLKNAQNASQSVLSLPIYPELSVNEIDYICQNISDYYNNQE